MFTTTATTTTFNMLRLLRALPTAATTTTTPTPTMPPPLRPQPTTFLRSFTTTSPLPANNKASDSKKKKPTKGGRMPTKKLDPAAARALARRRKALAEQKLDPKIAGMMAFLYAPTQTPAPLRMGRSRHLRHWVVHRAWQLWQRKREEGRTRELMRMRQGMSNACETLRGLEGPGTRPEGWLYRKAMEKVGVWERKAVPIEYARPLVETPGERPWDHEWKRM